MKINKKYEYKGMSKRAQNLLNRIEDYDVEFKESINTLEPADFVAFANSDKGGAILIGVRQVKKGKLKGKGEVIGCTVGDQEKLKIIDKAENCSPPINIEIFVENMSKNPFYRIEIQNCKDKPYSTSAGVYKIRGDGRNKALLPDRLLTMFVKAEIEKFIKGYREATKEVDDRIKELLHYIDIMSYDVRNKLTEILQNAEDTVDLTDDASTTSAETLGAILDLEAKLGDLNKYIPRLEEKINALIIKLKIEPIYSRLLKIARRNIMDSAILLHLYKGRNKYTKNEILNDLKLQYPWVSDENLEGWFKEGIVELKKVDKKKKKSS